jgi:hypothetical protein
VEQLKKNRKKKLYEKQKGQPMRLEASEVIKVLLMTKNRLKSLKPVIV